MTTSPTSSLPKALMVLGLASVSLAAQATGWQVESEVFSYNPAHLYDSTTHSTLGQWAGAGFQESSHVLSVGHPFEPPGSQAEASASFDQSSPEDAVLRGSAMMRLGYRVNDTNTWQANSTTNLVYGLEVTSNSNTDLDIVFGNQLHGVLAKVDWGRVSVRETMNLSDFGQFNSSVDLSSAGQITESGKWIGSTHQQDITDQFFGTVHDAYQMNSFHFYGTRRYAAHEVHVMDVSHQMYFQADFDLGTAGSGLALADFSNTGHMFVKAFDPVTGADRSDEIMVNVVPEPASLLVFGGFAVLAAHRRRAPRRGNN